MGSAEPADDHAAQSSVTHGDPQRVGRSLGGRPTPPPSLTFIFCPVHLDHQFVNLLLLHNAQFLWGEGRVSRLGERGHSPPRNPDNFGTVPILNQFYAMHLYGRQKKRGGGRKRETGSHKTAFCLVSHSQTFLQALGSQRSTARDADLASQRLVYLGVRNYILCKAESCLDHAK